MDFRTDEQFEQWLRERRIGCDPIYPNAHSLVYLDQPSLSRFWLPREVPSDLPDFLLTALRTASGEGAYWLWKRGGGRWYYGEHASSRDEIIDRLIAAAGVPKDLPGALGFTANDWSQALAVLVPFYVFGWSVGNDVYIVPQNRTCVLMLGHHGELSAEFADLRALEVFTGAMAAKGFHLPDHVPDATFKVPDWMARRGTA